MRMPSRKVLVAVIVALVVVAAAVAAIVALASRSGGSRSDAAVSQLPSLPSLAAATKPRSSKPKSSKPGTPKGTTTKPAVERLAFAGNPVYSAPHAGKTFVVRFPLRLVDATGQGHALPVRQVLASCKARAGAKPYTPGTATVNASGVTCSWKVPAGTYGATLVVVAAARAHGHEAPYKPLRTRVAAAPTPPPLVSNPPPSSSPQPPSSPPPPAPASTVQAPPLILPP